jgi:hypothetical protein
LSAIYDEDNASNNFAAWDANNVCTLPAALDANGASVLPVAATPPDALRSATVPQVMPAATASRRARLLQSSQWQFTARGATATTTSSIPAVQPQTTANAAATNAAAINTAVSRRWQRQPMAGTSAANNAGQHVTAAANTPDVPRVSRAALTFTNQGWDPLTWIVVPASGPLNMLEQNDEVLEVLRCAITCIYYYLVSHDAFPLRPARISACREALITAAQDEPQILNCITTDRSYRDWLSTVVSLCLCIHHILKYFVAAK